MNPTTITSTISSQLRVIRNRNVILIIDENQNRFMIDSFVV